jgi:hypothetical protein
VSLFADPDSPGLVARVGISGRKDPTRVEEDRYSAIFRRRSYRAPFSLQPVHPSTLRSLAHATPTPGAQVRVIDRRKESAALADLLGYAAAVLHDDRAYQRELTAWAPQFPQQPVRPSTVPWAGLVREDTRLADRITLTERLMTERLLVILTSDDTRRDHFLAGSAMQQIWLSAITRELVASVLTQPLHLHEVRAGLIERLELNGYPQLILRLGYPSTALPAMVRARNHYAAG